MANLGLQNNNPGNLKDPATGAFRTFDTPEAGHQALIDDLTLKQSGKSSVIKPGASIQDLANVWAPASDSNDPQAYAKTLATNLGVDTTHPFDQVPTDKLASAISVAEGTSTMPKTSTQSSTAPADRNSVIKANVLKLQNANATPEDIEAYVKMASQETVPDVTTATGPQLNPSGTGVNQSVSGGREISPVEKFLFGDKGIQMDNPLTEAIQKYFPGKEIGESIGTLGGYALTAIKEKLGMVPKGTTDNYDLSAPTPLQTAGDAAKIAATVGSMAVGAPESVLEAGAQGGIAGALAGGGEAATKTSNNPIPTGEDLGQTAVGALKGAGFGATTGALVYGLSNLLQSMGTKIQEAVIKPSKADIADGFKITNVQKYDVGGSLPTMLEKTQAKLSDLSNQLGEKLQGSDSAVNLTDVLDNTKASLETNKLRGFGSNTSMKNALDQLDSEIQVINSTGRVSVPDAQIVKQAAGHFGAWQFGKVDPESTAREKVYNAFYNQLKTAIEKASPAGVKEINQQISELIPISNAIIRRIPVASRNNVLSLGDLVSLGASAVSPKGIGATLLNFASKSGAVGDLLSRFAPRLGSISTPASAVAGGAAGGMANETP